MITVWGRRNSMNVQKAMWTLGELDLAYQRRDVGGSFGVTDSDTYRAMNPNGLVPTIEDGDLVLWESNAIVRYLARTYGGKGLWPTSNNDQALADQWMDWGISTFGPPFFNIFFNLIRLPPEKSNADLVSAGIKTSARLLGLLDHHLQGRAFVCGDVLSAGDIPLGVMAYRYFNLDIDRPAAPKVEAWFQRLQARPAYQKHVMIPFGRDHREWQELEQASAGIQ